jgi:hypothetical protein
VGHKQEARFLGDPLHALVGTMKNLTFVTTITCFSIHVLAANKVAYAARIFRNDTLRLLKRQKRNVQKSDQFSFNKSRKHREYHRKRASSFISGRP